MVYYKPKRKPDSLEKETIAIFNKHNGNYGSRRIKVILNREGIVTSLRRICKILKQNNLEPKYGRRKFARNIYTSKDERYITENLIRQMIPTTSNQILHTDFTELKCRDGKLYVSGMIDAYDKTVTITVGTNQTNEMVLENIEMLEVTPQILHSDRGSQYTSTKLRDYLVKRKIQRSMSAPYCPYENAIIETFWKTLKTEIGPMKYFTKHQASLVLAYYTNYYNTDRIHSAIGYLTPLQKRTLSFSNLSENG